jgi:hypothetical protein
VSLVQVNGRGCSFQRSVNAPMAAVSSLTEVKLPRRMAWRGDDGEEAFHEVQPRAAGGQEVQSDPLVLRSGQPVADLGVLVGGVVVAHHPQLAAGAGGGDLLQEAQELAVPVPGVAGVGDRAGGHIQGGEQRRGAEPDVVMGVPLGTSSGWSKLVLRPSSGR